MKWALFGYDYSIVPVPDIRLLHHRYTLPLVPDYPYYGLVSLMSAPQAPMSVKWLATVWLVARAIN